MIIDDCLLVLVHSQAEAVPPRVTTRAKILTKKSAPPVEPKQEQQAAIHSIEELAMIGIIDDMPVMQAARRTRAPATMAARPRVARPKVQRKVPIRTKEPRKPSSRAKKVAEAVPKPVRTQLTPAIIIANLPTPDEKLKERAIEIVQRDIISEPVTAMNTAIRIVMQASLDLGRPYDTNMLAITFSITRSLVMQSLRKHYEDFVEQSLFTEEHFVPTYLWIYGVKDPESQARVVRAIKDSGVAEPGSRSAFSIARDFVILYISEILHGSRVDGASVLTIMHAIKSPPDVPPTFIDMTNSFLYRARMTGRNILKTLPSKTNIASLFS